MWTFTQANVEGLGSAVLTLTDTDNANVKTFTMPASNVTIAAEFEVAHTHSFTYSAEGTIITASCGADGCGLTSAPTLTIATPTLTYSGQTGDGISASATLTGLADFNTATGLSVSADSIKYVGRDGTTYTESTTAPTAACKYTAKITLSGVTTSEGENQTVAASVDYSIKVKLTFIGTYTKQDVFTGDPPAASTQNTVAELLQPEDSTFTSWKSETDASGNVTYIAQFSYTVTLNANGGTINEGNITSYILSTGAALPTNVTKTNYSFGGWFDNENCTGTAVGNITATDIGNKTFYAKWNVNEYTIFFDTNGGTEIAPFTRNFGTSVTAPANPTRTGYTFAGWDKEIPATMPAENLIIKALWTKNAEPKPTPRPQPEPEPEPEPQPEPKPEPVKTDEFVVSFKSYGGSVVSSQTVESGKTASRPADPKKSGSEYNFGTPVTENITLRAVWTETPEKPEVPENTSFVYNGTEHTITPTDFDPETMTVS